MPQNWSPLVLTGQLLVNVLPNEFSKLDTILYIDFIEPETMSKCFINFCNYNYER